LHLLGDVINSLGVLIAAIIIYFTDGRMWYFDPICTYVFGVIVFYTTRITFAHCISMLMEKTPANVDLKLIRRSLNRVAGVQEVHDMHVWALSDGKLAFSVHLVVPVDTAAEISSKVLERCDLTLRQQFGLNHFSI